MEDEGEDSDAADEAVVCLVPGLEMQMCMRAALMSHSCLVEANGRYAIFTVDAVCHSCIHRHFIYATISFLLAPIFLFCHVPG